MLFRINRDIRFRGSHSGTCFDEISPDSERGDKKPVFLGTPLDKHYRHIAGMVFVTSLFRSSLISRSLCPRGWPSALRFA